MTTWHFQYLHCFCNLWANKIEC